MRSPLAGGVGWLELDEVGSTQDVAFSILNDDSPYGVVLAKDQKTGRGRRSREWVSTPGDSLTMSLIFREYADHPAPHLIGMALAIGVAGLIHAQLQWPNDLTVRKKKIGGLITEVKPDSHGRMVPIVGVGINLNQTTFPETIVDRAISLYQVSGRTHDAKIVAENIVGRLERVPEPDSWSSLVQAWQVFDDTVGKGYLLPDGERSIAMGLGSRGELLCSVEGAPRTVFAADAMFGTAEG
jgi:BirA family biotin operon repressor/biotin-[acetyl-CoA-carboxylase] ligase